MKVKLNQRLQSKDSHPGHPIVCSAIFALTFSKAAGKSDAPLPPTVPNRLQTDFLVVVGTLLYAHY